MAVDAQWRPIPKRPSGLNFSVSPAARKLRVAVYTRDGFTCQGCGYRPERIPPDYDGGLTIGDLTLDHIVAATRGGLWRIENLNTLCRSCNSRKGRS
jgi:5-methylcytosine-specific restriction endonuclease McrA